MYIHPTALGSEAAVNFVWGRNQLYCATKWVSCYGDTNF